MFEIRPAQLMRDVLVGPGAGTPRGGWECLAARGSSPDWEALYARRWADRKGTAPEHRIAEGAEEIQW